MTERAEGRPGIISGSARFLPRELDRSSIDASFLYAPESNKNGTPMPQSGQRFIRNDISNREEASGKS